jgi:hypothetical protein
MDITQETMFNLTIGIRDSKEPDSCRISADFKVRQGRFSSATSFTWQRPSDLDSSFT